MSRLLDDFILRYHENQRIDFLTLNEFILEVSDEIYLEKKYGDYLFYMAFNRPILFINLDAKLKIFYIGFTDGKKLNDKNDILQDDTTKVISKWFYLSSGKLINDSANLKDLILQAINFNRKKLIKH